MDFWVLEQTCPQKHAPKQVTDTVSGGHKQQRFDRVEFNISDDSKRALKRCLGRPLCQLVDVDRLSLPYIKRRYYNRGNNNYFYYCH